MSAVPTPPDSQPSALERTRVKHALHVVEREATKLELRFPGRADARALYAVGTFALYRAARRFRDELSRDFVDYARRCVRGAMLDSLRLEKKEERRKRAAVKGADLYLATYRDDELNIFLHDEDTEVGRRFQECADDLLAATFAAMAEEMRRSDEEDPVADEEESRRALTALASAMDALTVEQREILTLVYRRQKTLDDAAQALELTYITTRRRHAEALARLREELEKLGVDRAPPIVDEGRRP